MDRKSGGGRIPIMQMLVIGLILSVQLQQISASFKSCYVACLLNCLIGVDTYLCSGRCTRECAIDEHEHQIDSKTEDYCSIGCYVDQCAKYGRDVGKVKGCVKNCDKNICSTKKLPIN